MSICDECRAIDFEKAFKVPSSVGGDRPASIILDQKADRFLEASDSSCDLCRLLKSTLYDETIYDYDDEPSESEDPDEIGTRPYQLQAFSFLRNCQWAPWVTQDRPDCHVLVTLRHTRFEWSHSFEPADEFGYVVCLPRIREAGMFLPQRIGLNFDRSKARLWIENCKQSHGLECNGTTDTIPGMRV